MTAKKIGGYAFRSEVEKARINNQIARESLQQLLDGNPGPTQAARLVARASNSLAATMEALAEIEHYAPIKHISA
jgi:hypothetical protein